VEISITRLRASLSAVLRSVASGEEVVVTHHGRPYVRLLPVRARKRTLPRVGAFEGQYKLPDDWDNIPTGFERIPAEDC